MVKTGQLPSNYHLWYRRMLVHHLQIKVRIVLFLISLFEFYLPGIRQIDLIQFYLEIYLHAMDVIYLLLVLPIKVVN